MVADASLYTDFQGFTDMRRQAREETPEAVKKVAKHFESLFIQMMLKSMRDTLPKDGIFSSNTQRMYEDMFDKQLSLQMSTNKGIGLANVIERQLSRSQPDLSRSIDVQDYFNRAVPNRSVINKQDTNNVLNEIKQIDNKVIQEVSWNEPEEYIRDLWPHAQMAAEELGVDADVLIAQSALETGWGKHVRRMDDGQNSFSLFGIKANHHWEGKRNLVPTLEFRNGAMQKEYAHFRAYDSVEAAFQDYVNFIKSNPRYQKVLEEANNPDAYGRELQRAGYATDPDYADKIKRIRTSELMKNQVSVLKKIEDQPLTLSIPESHVLPAVGVKRG